MEDTGTVCRMSVVDKMGTKVAKAVVTMLLAAAASRIIDSVMKHVVIEVKIK